MEIDFIDRRGHGHHLLIRGLAAYIERHRLVWSVRSASGSTDPTSLAGVCILPSGSDLPDPWREAIARRLVVQIADHALPPRPGLVTLRPDDRAIGAVAARHFHQHGYRRGITVGRWEHPGRRARAQAFAEAGRRLGLAVDHLAPERPHPDGASLDALLREFIEQRPAPLALFCHHDRHAAWMVERLPRLGIAVPGRVAVLGFGDEAGLCESLRPTLSSIAWPWFEMGLEAGLQLHRLIQGEDRAYREVLVRPLVVSERASTPWAKSDDPLVGEVDRFLRRHLLEDLTVPELAARFATTRTTLQRRFHRAFGQGVNQRLLALRVARARDLLLAGDRPIQDIARICGYRHVNRLLERFRRAYGTSPGCYRREAAKGSVGGGL